MARQAGTAPNLWTPGDWNALFGFGTPFVDRLDRELVGRGGREVARAAAPTVEVVDSTGAGDAFTAALVVSLLEGLERQEALERACAVGAEAATRLGAQWI